MEVTHDDTDSTSTVKPIPLYVQDYIFRGAELEEYSLYELMGVAYAKGATKTEMDRYANATEASPSEGRSLWNRRVLFQPQHSKVESRWISFMRHPKVPCIVGNRSTDPSDIISMYLLLMRQGPSIPHSESESTERLVKRAFLLLLLFKPWRENADIKYGEDQSWTDALAEFERECGNSFCVYTC